MGIIPVFVKANSGWEYNLELSYFNLCGLAVEVLIPLEGCKSFYGY